MLRPTCWDHWDHEVLQLWDCTTMQPPCYLSGEKKHTGEKKVWNKHFKTRSYPQNILIIYPVFEIGKIPSSSAASETRWSTSGCPKRTLAQGSAPASAGSHKTSTAEAASSSVVPERDAECLWIHASLFSPGRPSFPETQQPVLTVFQLLFQTNLNAHSGRHDRRTSTKPDHAKLILLLFMYIRQRFALFRIAVLVTQYIFTERQINQWLIIDLVITSFVTHKAPFNN